MHKLIDDRFEELVADLKYMLSFRTDASLYEPTENDPFGRPMTDALNAFLKRAESYGFTTILLLTSHCRFTALCVIWMSYRLGMNRSGIIRLLVALIPEGVFMVVAVSMIKDRRLPVCMP